MKWGKAALYREREGGAEESQHPQTSQPEKKQGRRMDKPPRPRSALPKRNRPKKKRRGTRAPKGMASAGPYLHGFFVVFFRRRNEPLPPNRTVLAPYRLLRAEIPGSRISFRGAPTAWAARSRNCNASCRNIRSKSPPHFAKPIRRDTRGRLAGTKAAFRRDVTKGIRKYKANLTSAPVPISRKDPR